MTVAAPPAEDLKLVQFARCIVTDCRPTGEPLERFEAGVLAPLREWCAARSDRVQAAYVTLPRQSSSFHVHVVGRTVRYDSALGGDVSNLTLTLFAQGWDVLCEYVPAPVTDDGSNIFFDPTAALLVYADR